VVGERRQPARADRDQEHETGPFGGRLPERGIALKRGVGRLQVVIGDDAEHMIGGVVALLHPGVNIVPALYLPFVDVRRVAKRLQLLGDPERPVAVA
jgi:hypothetical protein